MVRIAALLTLLVGLTACADATRDLARPVEALGDFRLGHNIVLAPNLEQYLVSREASEEELVTAVDEQMRKRFGRFDGGRYYHFGISIEAYSLPPPIVPGKTFLAMRVTVWDDATQTKLNDETELVSAILLLESRLATSREESIRAIAAEAAKQTEVWLRKQMDNEDWFRSTSAPMPETVTEPMPEVAADASSQTVAAADSATVVGTAQAAGAGSDG